MLLTDLDIIFNHALNTAQLGVSVTRCPATAIGPAGCASTLLDQAVADREWITTTGTNAWLSYHDSKASSLIHVWRSTDDSTAVWNTYDSQLNGGVWSTGPVSNTPNRIVGVCLQGSACTADRELPGSLRGRAGSRHRQGGHHLHGHDDRYLDVPGRDASTACDRARLRAVTSRAERPARRA
jgi:hypothetical protein